MQKLCFGVFWFGVTCFGSFGLKALSTTDYLVRLEALAYLEELIDEKSQIQVDKKSVSATLTEITESETRELAQKVVEANQELAELASKIEEEIEILRSTQELNKAPVKAALQRAQDELQSITDPGFKQRIVNGQKKTWKEFVVGKPRLTKMEVEELKRNEIERLKNEVAFWEKQLVQINSDLKNPEAFSKQVQEKYAEVRSAILDERDDVIRVLEEIKIKSGIFNISNQLARLEAREKALSSKAACLIELASCDDIKSWETFQKSQALDCKSTNWDMAQPKAKNPACAKLWPISTWREIHACIPEYRAKILKGRKGEIGSRAKFDACLEK